MRTFDVICVDVQIRNASAATRMQKNATFSGFPYSFEIFLNSASSAAALVFYLPVVCTHTDTKGKQRQTRVRNILKALEKKTIFNEHPVL